MKADLIGLGRMGLRHLQALKELEITVDAVSDIREESFENAKSNLLSLNTTKFYNAPLQMIKSRKAELLVIATTAPSHHEYVLAAAKNGYKYILCEKPMATSIAQCKEMNQICKDCNTALAINHPVCFSTADIKIKELLNSEDFGGLESAVIQVGNYGIAMNASHDIEMFKFLTGEYPAKIQAWLDNGIVANPRGKEFEDKSGIIKITTQSGKTLIINTKSTHHHGAFNVYTAKYGQIFWDALSDNIYLNYRKKEFRNEPSTQYAKPFEVQNIALPSNDLVSRTKKVLQALISGSGYPSSEEVINTIKSLVAAHISHEKEGAEIDIQNYELPENRVFPWA